MSDLFAQLQASLGDEYALERELPAAGSSRIFIARERIFNRAIQIKVLPAEHAAGLDFDRFASEVEQAAALNIPTVVPPLMLGVVSGLPYIITPYVPGVTLRARMVEQPPLSLEEIVAILRSLAESLHAVHSNHALHLDLNPDTILLSQKATMITDTGTVRALRGARADGSPFVGDPSYMAPEQLSPTGKPDHHADIYAWGSVAYEMLTGMPPYPRVVTDGRVLDTKPEEPAPITLARRDVPNTLVRLIMRTLSRDVLSRPSSADSLLQVLQTVDVSEKALAERSLTPAFVPAVAADAEVVPTTTSRTTRAVPAVPVTTKRDVRKLAMLGGIGTAVLALIAYLALREPPLPEEKPIAAPPVAVVAKSVAILPIASVGGDADVAAGLSVELAQLLARAGTLVTGISSAGVLKAQGLDPRTVGQRLGAASVLTGTMKEDGGMVQLSVALLSADGSTKWSADFTRPIADLFAVEEEIVRTVHAKVQGAASVPPAATITPESMSPVAHALVLQGNALAARNTAVSLDGAIGKFQAAIAQDSNYARAWAALALASAAHSEIETGASAGAQGRTARAANRAIALDSTLAASYAALGWAHATRGENRTAEKLFKRSVTLDSTVALTWGWYGLLASHIGDYATGHARVQRARTLEPMLVTARAWDADVFFGEEKSDRAEQATRPIPQLDSTLSRAVLTRVQSLIALQKDTTAFTLLETRVGAQETGVTSEAQAMLAYAYAVAGEEQKARDIMLAMRDASGGALPPRATLAATLAALGDVDSAIGLLGKAIAQGDPSLFTSNRAPRFTLLRKDPRGATAFESIERW